MSNKFLHPYPMKWIFLSPAIQSRTAVLRKALTMCSSWVFLRLLPRKIQSDSQISLFTFLVKEMYDYQGRSYLHVPQDVGVNLRSTVPPEKCYLPKKQIHVWSGHTKVGSLWVYFFYWETRHFVSEASNFYKAEVSVEGRNIFLIYDTQLMASYAPHEMFAWSEVIVSDTSICFYIDIVTSWHPLKGQIFFLHLCGVWSCFQNYHVHKRKANSRDHWKCFGRVKVLELFYIKLKKIGFVITMHRHYKISKYIF